MNFVAPPDRLLVALAADDIVTRVIALWDQKLDTVDIAKRLNKTEAAVAAALRIGRERRRVQP